MPDQRKPGVKPQMEPAGEVRCAACLHYYITHDRSFPYGCRAVGFKSRVLPAQEMAAHSGLPCQAFVPKTGR